MSILTDNVSEGNAPLGSPVFADEAVEAADTSARGNVVADAYMHATEQLSADNGRASLNQIIDVATRAYLDRINPAAPPLDHTLEKQLVFITNGAIQSVNLRTKVAGEKLPMLHVLKPVQVAMIVARLYDVAEVTPGGAQQDDGMGVLALYQNSGADEGLYRRVDLGLLRGLGRRYNLNHDGKWFSEFEQAVRDFAPKVSETQDTDLVVMRNLIYNYRSDMRIPFSPDYVFLSRHSETVLIDQQHPESAITITSDDGRVWNYEEWWAETIPDEGTRSYVQHVIGAAFRPGHDWQKMPCLFSDTGSNGKGTILAHIRAMIGQRNCVSVPIKRYGSQFGKSQLIGARLNLPDETPVGEFIKDATDLKSIITNDPIEIDRKHKDPITYKPSLLTILTLNDELNFRDKTKSMDRRISFIPMTKGFGDGVKIKAIKDDYLLRREVCEYMAYKVLVEMPKFWELEEPPAVKRALHEHKVKTHTVLAFFTEYKDDFERPFLPFPMLRALYVVWLKENRSSARPVEAVQFTKDIKEYFDESVWVVPQAADGSDLKMHTRNWLTKREPALDEFHYVDEVNKWQYVENHPYNQGPIARSAPRQVRGLMRRDVYEAWVAAGSGSGPVPAAKAVDTALTQRYAAQAQAAGGDTTIRTIDTIEQGA